MKFCILDTNILINIIRSKDYCNRLMSHLRSFSYHIILPKKVEEEFINNNNKNKKNIEKFKSKYQIETCDINNSQKELSETGIDYGEADAFLQIIKKSRKFYSSGIKSEFLFITEDKTAIRYFQSNGLSAKKLKDIFPIY